MKKMIMLIYNISLGSKIEELLKKCKINEFTIIPHVIGKGTAGGARFNNEIFPGENNLAYIAMDNNSEEMKSFKKRIDEIKKEFKKDGITYFIIPLEE
ncbi:hypothetical protein J7L48_00030 [bacterium]|nr:hypothetical protein [bacterium]